MRRVFSNGLPKWEQGRNNGKVNWKETVGHKVNFIYDNIKGEIEIIDYKKDGQLLYFKYNNEIYNLTTNCFTRGNFGKILGKINSDHIYEIGEVVNGGKLKILDKIRKGSNNRKYYKYECLVCGNFDSMIEYNINNGNGCNVCSGKKVLSGVNSMWDTNKKLANMLYNPEDGYNYTEKSNMKVDFKCLDCGSRIENKTIINVNKYGVSCPKCSDGISFPEKILYFVLKELKIEFEMQKSFNWSNHKRYDFYVPFSDMIIEAHGDQHYNGGFERAKGRTLEEEIENDKLKEKLAKENGIEHYLVIDCRKSELEWIKGNIINSELNVLFDLNKVDWLKIGGLATKTMIKTTCDLFNKDQYMLKEISEIMNLSTGTIRTYLKQGAKLGWCNYKPHKITKSNKENISKRNSKPVVQLTLDEEFIKEWDSAHVASKELNINSESIKNVSRGVQKTAGGFTWKYKENYKECI